MLALCLRSAYGEYLPFYTVSFSLKIIYFVHHRIAAVHLVMTTFDEFAVLVEVGVVVANGLLSKVYGSAEAVDFCHDVLLSVYVFNLY
jgi:hypothetical protein